MSDRPYGILFLCTGNSARSIMAECPMNYRGGGRFRGFSAGSYPKGQVHPMAVELLNRMHLPTDGLRSKSWNEFAAPGAPPLDFIITVCDNAAGEVCPVWPGKPMTAHWGVADPAGAADADRALAFRKAFKELDTRIQLLTNLPIDSLDQLKLQERLREIGRPAPSVSMHRRLAAEGIGSLLLAATVIGSGIMAEGLAGGNLAVALIANTGATVAVLATLIALLGPVSGAHFNPAVSFVQALRGVLPWQHASAYAAAQVAGCCAGAILAHAMFALPLIQFSVHARTGAAQWLAEFVATFGLVLVVLGQRRAQDGPWMIAGWIGAAYWFTSSTSFANPAITIARSLSNTFAGIAPSHVPGFIAAQFLGAAAAIPVARLLFAQAGTAAAAKT